MLPAIQRAMAMFFESTDKNDWIASTAAHHKIIAAIEKHDPDAARDAMIEHLGFNKKRFHIKM